MPKKLSFSNKSREAIEKGVNTVADAVRVTIGPKAKNVVIERKFGSPDVVRDGSTVAKEINLENPISNLGAKLIEQVASKTKESAGDGTTTATILTQAMVQEVWYIGGDLDRCPLHKGPLSVSAAGWSWIPSMVIAHRPSRMFASTPA